MEHSFCQRRKRFAIEILIKLHNLLVFMAESFFHLMVSGINGGYSGFSHFIRIL